MSTNAASNVARGGRTGSIVLRLALVLALLFGGASAVLAGNGVGAVFNLGQTNSVNALSVLTGAATGALLRISNTGAGSALNLRVATPGRAPMTLNSNATGRVVHLNADKVDGMEAAAFLPALGKAADSEKLDGIDSTGFQLRVTGTCAVGSSISAIGSDGSVTCEEDDDLSGDPAGGALTGSYPNPAIAAGAVDSDKVANGSLLLADLQGVGTSAGGSFNFTVPAKGCDAPFDTGIGTASAFQVGDLVVWKVTQGTLPDGVYMPAVSVTRADRIPQLFCNVTASEISVSGNFSFAVRAVR